MTFGQAIESLKAGKSVQRAGWNGKGMHVYLEEHMSWPTVRLTARGGAIKDTPRAYDPCLVLFTAAGTHQPGWNASTPDVLAEDWQIVDHD